MSETTASYADLGNELFTTCVEAISANNQRFLGFWKSVAEIATRPYPVGSFDDVVRENAERSTALVDLTVKEIEAAGERLSDFTKSLVAIAGKVQDQSTSAARVLYDTSVSNLNFVKNSTTKLDKIYSKA